MVLINGVKYACERCIRGHRVTTCTHTDQPLMMIKPKGRPSTACDHCKNARKLKNQHQKCTCSSKRSPGQPHESTCACKDDDSCTCQKAPHKKKNGTVHTPLKKQNSTKKKLQQPQQVTLQILHPPVDSSDFSLMQRSSLYNLDDLNNGNDKFHSFDMNLSGGSLSSDISNLPTHTNSVASNLNLLPQGRIGMDYLADFKPTTSPINSSRIGEVTVPLDEYVQPLQQMTTNLNNLLSSNNGNHNNGIKEEDEVPLQQQQQQQQQDDFFNDIPVPFGGNGLLDLFQDTSIMSNLNESSASVNTTSSSVKFRSKSPTLSELSPSNTGSRFPPSASTDSMFPLFQVVGSASSTASLSPASSSDHPVSQQLTPHHLHHHYQQLPPHHSNHQHTHYQTHFSPYPVPKRSESFLSISSSTTSELHQQKRPPINQSTDSLVSLHQQQTLTNNNNTTEDLTPPPSDRLENNLNNANIIENFDLFDGNSIDSFLNKTNFNV